MAGHSRWANIRFRKSFQDARRSKLFTKYIREITVSVRQAGADPTSNPRLRTAIDKALTANMTRDTIDRAIKRGTGEQEGQELEEVRYEGYGPGGVAILVDCMTNNRKRTVSEVRHAFTKYGGNLGLDGSVAYLFTRQGQIIFPAGTDENKVMELALEADALDVQMGEEERLIMITRFEDFPHIYHRIEQAHLKPEHAEVLMLPAAYVSLTDKEAAEKFNKLINTLEDLEDVQAVYSNGDIPEALLLELGLLTW